MQIRRRNQMNNNPTGKEMIIEYMKEHGFTGLYCPEADNCGCTIDDIAPCGNDECLAGAFAGYKRDCIGEQCLWYDKCEIAADCAQWCVGADKEVPTKVKGE